MAGPQPLQPSTVAGAQRLQPGDNRQQPSRRPPAHATQRNIATRTDGSALAPSSREGGCQEIVSDTPAGRGAAGGGPQGVAELLLRACRPNHHDTPSHVLDREPKKNSPWLITTRRRTRCLGESREKRAATPRWKRTPSSVRARSAPSGKPTTGVRTSLLRIVRPAQFCVSLACGRRASSAEVRVS